ncbi:hypothetical protein CKO51_12045 [Rhodopirellula sp. SM50]|nr:hypothetical protein [Rhodopirellula sp. SM50]PAY19337.1 hypothetical protein CKO51_12045 [Rhodopirellula sp. SM50]
MMIPKAITDAARQWKRSRQWRQTIGQFFDQIDYPSPDRGRVLHYVGIGAMYQTPLEILMYHGLRKRGYEVDYLIYDDSPCLNEITTKARIDSEGLEAFWKRSSSDAYEMLRLGKVDFKTIPLSPFASERAAAQKSLDELFQFEHDGIEFGQIVLGCMYRYYKSLEFGEDADVVARGMLETALRNYVCVKKLCQSHSYDFAMFSHGIYVTWQPVAEFCQRNGLDYVCYDRAKTQNTGNFNLNRPAPDWSFPTAWDRYIDRKLSEDESDWVTQYLKQRESQDGDVYSYNPVGRAENIAQEKMRLGIPLDRKVVTVFTNLIWDAANVARDIAFESCLDCITKTIAHFAGREGVHVVVRSHPAEAVLGTEQQYGGLIRSQFGNAMPGNVTLVEPENEVNSFTMIEMSDVGVVNTSTVGLEMAISGKPIILISETHFRGKGFTYDVEAADDYFATLEMLLETGTLKPNQVQLSRKYFFMMMSLYQQKLPTTYDERGRFTGYICKNFEQLGDDQPVMRILNQVCDQLPTDFVYWPE